MKKNRSNKRQELDININTVLLFAIISTIVTYVVLFPFQNSFIGILLYQRGITQYIVVFFAYIVAVLTLLKFLKLKQELSFLKVNIIPETISFENIKSKQLISLQQNLIQNDSVLASRCRRIISIYLASGNRKTATELALDDSSFYLSASESFYTFPRILVWAIPLLGFIGTVIGISSAVNGFSGFLEQAQEVDQIKEGIGTVTSGLAVAFDTTLLALLLSVVVMIPLVLVERLESQLLLEIDVYINDKLLPKFKDRESSANNINRETLQQVVKEAFTKNFPTSEQLIKPAEEYAKVAASQLAQGFIQEISIVERIGNKLITEIERVSKNTTKDRQEFITYLQQQEDISIKIIDNIQELISQINSSQSEIKHDFIQQTKTISFQLEQASKTLENRIQALEKCTSNISAIVDLQSSLDQSLRTLEKTAQLEQVLIEVKTYLAELKPVLQQLNKPRKITLIETDGKNL